MNWLSPLFIIIICFVFLLSVFRYTKIPASLKTKQIFIFMRLLITILLIIAFIEPSFHFQRVTSVKNDIPVLVDASLSMSLFQPESTVIPFIKSLLDINSSASVKSKKYKFFQFGDSIRDFDNPDFLKFKDQHSNFPIDSDILLSKSSDIIIISDANWTNSLVPDDFSDKNIQYLNLHRFKHFPFLKIVNSEISNTPADSPAVLLLTVEGRIDKKTPLVVDITEGNKRITDSSFDINPGYFINTVKIILPPTSSGKHLYRFNVSCYDSLKTSAFNVRNARPSKFLYQLQSSSPSIDKRFISLALSKHSEFKKAEPANVNKRDCIFFFSWNDTSKSLLKNLKHSGVAVFAGSIPCNSYKPVNPSTNFQIFRTQTASSMALKNLITEKLPPPSKILYCPDLTIKMPLLSITSDKHAAKDTFHLIFNTQLPEQAIVLAATDFWRWDFWPLSIDYSEEQTFSFSQLFLTVIKEQLLSRISEQYFLYPVSNSSESDSLILSVSFPSTIPVANKATIRVLIKSITGKTVADTSVEILNTGSTNQKIAIKPVTAGEYYFTSTISGNNHRYSFSDSLHIENQNDELQITGQNTLLLNEIAQPLNINDSLASTSLLVDNSQSKQFIKDSYHLNRNWLLLILIFILLGAEWTYRRFIGLD